MRLLLTRPADSSDELSAGLLALGHRVMHEPLLKIEAVPVPTPPAAGIQAIVATSANALRNLSAGPELKALTLYAVGRPTANLARDLGFRSVVEGPGTASQLAELIAAERKPDQGALVYLRGEDVAFDLQAALAARGFAVVPVLCYRTIAAVDFSDGLIAALRANALDAALLMSPRTAEVYVSLAQKAGVLDSLKCLRHFCLSKRVADPLTAAGLNEIHVPARPTGEELVALIGANDTHSLQSA